MRISGKKQNS